MTGKGIMSREAANLDPPKDDPISLEELSKSDGMLNHLTPPSINRLPYNEKRDMVNCLFSVVAFPFLFLFVFQLSLIPTNELALLISDMSC